MQSHLKIHWQIFFMRLVVGGLLLLNVWAARTFTHGIEDWVLLVIGLTFLIYPSLIMYAHKNATGYSRKMHYEKIEHKGVYADCFMCGLIMPLVHFYPPTAFLLLIGPMSTLISMAGTRLILIGLLWLGMGLLVSILPYGVHFQHESHTTLLILAGLAFTLHFGGTAFLNHRLSMKVLYAKKKLNEAYEELDDEKQNSDRLLHNILPESIAKELKEKGAAEAKEFPEVTILFTDFKGFTELSQKLNARELVWEINECYKAFDGIMEKYRVEKIKTIGDAYMAAGGLPITNDDSTKKTVMAALELRNFIIKRKAELEKQQKSAFEMRLGVHTGPVVAGIVGVKKFQYDIWGDTVNTASRMESSGEVGKVNISQTTYNLIKEDSDFVFESRGKVLAKGKGEIEMYFVEIAE